MLAPLVIFPPTNPTHPPHPPTDRTHPTPQTNNTRTQTDTHTHSFTTRSLGLILIHVTLDPYGSSARVKACTAPWCTSGQVVASARYAH
jgi:hypothetical protein